MQASLLQTLAGAEKADARKSAGSRERDSARAKNAFHVAFGQFMTSIATGTDQQNNTVGRTRKPVQSAAAMGDATAAVAKFGQTTVNAATLNVAAQGRKAKACLAGDIPGVVANTQQKKAVAVTAKTVVPQTTKDASAVKPAQVVGDNSVSRAVIANASVVSKGERRQASARMTTKAEGAPNAATISSGAGKTEAKSAAAKNVVPANAPQANAVSVAAVQPGAITGAASGGRAVRNNSRTATNAKRANMSNDSAQQADPAAQRKNFTEVMQAATPVNTKTETSLPDARVAIEAVARAGSAGEIQSQARAAETHPAAQLDIEQFMEQIKLHARIVYRDGGVQEVRIQLQPSELGGVSLRLSLENNQLQAQARVETPAAQETLERLMPQLRETLLQDGMNLRSFDVDLRGQERQPRETPQRKTQRGDGDSAMESVAAVAVAVVAPLASGALDFVV